MKVLLPIKTHGVFDINSDKVSGGIEMFAKHLYKNIDSIIPIVLKKEDIEQRKTQKIIEDAICLHKPDVLLANDLNMSIIGHNIPTVVIIHMGDENSIGFITALKNIQKLSECKKDFHVYFVSDTQKAMHEKTLLRVSGKDIW